MKVGELIAELQKHDQDLPVFANGFDCFWDPHSVQTTNDNPWYPNGYVLILRNMPDAVPTRSAYVGFDVLYGRIKDCLSLHCKEEVAAGFDSLEEAKERIYLMREESGDTRPVSIIKTEVVLYDDGHGNTEAPVAQ